jgi:tRNA nucleotidyltransferase/poly(A) polymerase
LRYAAERQLDGDLTAAQTQYEAVLTDEMVNAEIKEQASASLQWLEQAQALWDEVNQAWDGGDWNTALAALEELQNLEGFGPLARDTQSDNTVDRLVEMAIIERDRPPAPAIRRLEVRRAVEVRRAAVQHLRRL